MADHELLVLLGAGASLPGMCTVGDLTRFLVEWRGRLEPPHAPGDTNRDILTLPLVENDSRQPLFLALREMLAPRFRDPNHLDFELLLHVCEQLATIFPIPQGDHVVDRFRSLIEPFVAPSPAAAHYNLPSLVSAVQDACYAILDQIAETCMTVSTPSHPQAVGLGRLGALAQLAVHSLNYDDIPYESGLELYDGFDHSSGEFRPDYPWPRRSHSLCQLHGSVRWGMTPFPNAELRWFTSRAAATDSRTVRRAPGQFMDRHEAADTPMITGLRKADRILSRPYGTYFHACRDDLLRIPNWLIVGYGFRDSHVNHMLSQARNNWRQRGQSQRVVIVDYHRFQHADEHGVEDARHDWPAGQFLDRVLRPAFRDELIAFNTPLNPVLQRDVLNVIADGLRIWPSGSASGFSTGLDEISDWLVSA